MRHEHLPRRLVPQAWKVFAGMCWVLGGYVASGLATAHAEEGLPEVEFSLTSLQQLMDIEVFTASKFSQNTLDAPSSVTIIGQREIRQFGYRTLADILNSIRGIYITYDRYYHYVGVRGFARPGDYNGRILLLLDGHRLNDGVYDQAAIGTDFPLEVDLIERVEFVPGPGSALFGSNAFFGVVNVITKKRQSDQDYWASADVASFQARRGQVSVSKTLSERSSLLVTASSYDYEGDDLYFPEFDDPSTNNGVAENNDQEQTRGIFLKYVWSDLTLEAAYHLRNKPLPTAVFEQVFNDPRSDSSDDRAFFGLSYQGQLNETLEFSANLSYGKYWYDGVYVYDYPPVLENFDRSENSWYAGEWRWLSTAWQNHKATIGLEYRYDAKIYQTNFDDLGLYLDDKREKTAFGLYVQDEWTATEQLLVNVGVRHDRIHHDDQITNPRLALVYKPYSNTAYKLLYGTAFRSPNAYESFYRSPTTKSDPNIGPEKIQTVEGAVEHFFSNRWRAIATAYWYRADDLINLVEDPSDTLLVYRNLNQANATGLELESEMAFAPGERIKVSYTLQNVEDDSTGEQLSNSPRHLLKLHGQHALWPWLNAGLEVLATSRMRNTQGNTVPGHGQVNLTLLNNTLLAGLDVSFSMYNLLDRAYGDPASEEHKDSMGRILQRIPQDGRVYRLKLSYMF